MICALSVSMSCFFSTTRCSRTFQLGLSTDHLLDLVDQHVVAGPAARRGRRRRPQSPSVSIPVSVDVAAGEIHSSSFTLDLRLAFGACSLSPPRLEVRLSRLVHEQHPLVHAGVVDGEVAGGGQLLEVRAVVLVVAAAQRLGEAAAVRVGGIARRVAAAAVGSDPNISGGIRRVRSKPRVVHPSPSPQSASTR